jgi:hypothetical protein
MSTILERVVRSQAMETIAYAPTSRPSVKFSGVVEHTAFARLGRRGVALIATCLLATTLILHPVSAQIHSHLAQAPVILADGGGAPATACGGGAGGPC